MKGSSLLTPMFFNYLAGEFGLIRSLNKSVFYQLCTRVKCVLFGTKIGPSRIAVFHHHHHYYYYYYY